MIVSYKIDAFCWSQFSLCNAPFHVRVCEKYVHEGHLRFMIATKKKGETPWSWEGWGITKEDSLAGGSVEDISHMCTTTRRLFRVSTLKEGFKSMLWQTISDSIFCYYNY